MRPGSWLGLIAGVTLSVLGADRVRAGSEWVIRVTPTPRDSVVLVSFAADPPVDSELSRAIQSGMPATFTYDVELRHSSAFWFDRLIGYSRLAATIRYEPLARRYQVSLTQDGRVAFARSTEDPELARQWVSAFTRLPLFGTQHLERNGRYYVLIRGRTSPRRTWSFWPWPQAAASGSAAFTFLP